MQLWVRRKDQLCAAHRTSNAVVACVAGVVVVVVRHVVVVRPIDESLPIYVRSMTSRYTQTHMHKSHKRTHPRDCACTHIKFDCERRVCAGARCVCACLRVCVTRVVGGDGWRR